MVLSCALTTLPHIHSLDHRNAAAHRLTRGDKPGRLCSGRLYYYCDYSTISPHCLQLDIDGEPTILEDALTVADKLDAIREDCLRAESFPDFKTFKFWHTYLYPILSKPIRKSLTLPPTQLSLVQINDKYPGLLHSTVWCNICDRYCRKTKDPRERSDTFLDIAFTALRFHENIFMYSQT